MPARQQHAAFPCLLHTARQTVLPRAAPGLRSRPRKPSDSLYASVCFDWHGLTQCVGRMRSGCILALLQSENPQPIAKLEDVRHYKDTPMPWLRCEYGHACSTAATACGTTAVVGTRSCGKGSGTSASLVSD